MLNFPTAKCDQGRPSVEPTSTHLLIIHQRRPMCSSLYTSSFAITSISLSSWYSILEQKPSKRAVSIAACSCQCVLHWFLEHRNVITPLLVLLEFPYVACIQSCFDQAYIHARIARQCFCRTIVVELPVLVLLGSHTVCNFLEMATYVPIKTTDHIEAAKHAARCQVWIWTNSKFFKSNSLQTPYRQAMPLPKMSYKCISGVKGLPTQAWRAADLLPDGDSTATLVSWDVFASLVVRPGRASRV